jgi:hypothetical protein
MNAQGIRDINTKNLDHDQTMQKVVAHTSEVITSLILFGLGAKRNPTKTEQVKDFIYKCKWEIVFLQNSKGEEGFKSDWVDKDIKRYTHYLDINLDRLTALEIKRLEKLNSVVVFPKSRMEIIVAARQSALDFYYSLDVHMSVNREVAR